MKTYKKTIDTNKLIIEYDRDTESPRKWGNIGYFLTKEGNYKSPDGNTNPLYDIIIETENTATDTENHITLIKKMAKEEGIKILHIYPVYRYEHGNVIYKREIAHGFDYSNCGFYIITEESYKKCFHNKTTKQQIEKNIDSELDTYNKWINGEIYLFTLYNNNGEIEDSCGGFYDIEDIREYLPEEWKNEDLKNYLI